MPSLLALIINDDLYRYSFGGSLKESLELSHPHISFNVTPSSLRSAPRELFYVGPEFIGALIDLVQN